MLSSFGAFSFFSFFSFFFFFLDVSSSSAPSSPSASSSPSCPFLPFLSFLGFFSFFFFPFLDFCLSSSSSSFRIAAFSSERGSSSSSVRYVIILVKSPGFFSLAFLPSSGSARGSASNSSSVPAEPTSVMAISSSPSFLDFFPFPKSLDFFFLEGFSFCSSSCVPPSSPLVLFCASSSGILSAKISKISSELTLELSMEFARSMARLAASVPLSADAPPDTDALSAKDTLSGTDAVSDKDALSGRDTFSGTGALSADATLSGMEILWSTSFSSPLISSRSEPAFSILSIICVTSIFSKSASSKSAFKKLIFSSNISNDSSFSSTPEDKLSSFACSSARAKRSSIWVSQSSETLVPSAAAPSPDAPPSPSFSNKLSKNSSSVAIDTPLLSSVQKDSICFSLSH